MNNFNFTESSTNAGTRDLMDIMESYKYLNSFLLNDTSADGRWDYATGWLELNMSREEWHVRSNNL